ncbi:MAG: DUF2157 domain-containing protein [Robiginitomaculum sp.]|nr:DUF2157 domain-containing protein [Robiginitomaculum sp.]
MRTPFYMKTLQQDLGHWIDQGWVDADHKDKILQHAASKKSSMNVISILVILGVVLLGFAAISFVAANWAGMGKLIRVALILSAMWIAFLIAAFALSRKVMVYAHAFGLLGAILFGAGIMLIAQTFNIQAHYPTGVLIWFFGAFTTAFILQSKPILIFSCLLAGLWMSMAFAGNIPDNLQLWLFPVLAIILAFSAIRLKSKVSLHIIAISLIVYLSSCLFRGVDTFDIEIGMLFSLNGGVFIIAALLFSLLPKGFFGRNVFVGWLALAVLTTAFSQQFGFNSFNNEYLLLGVLAGALLLIVALLVWHWRTKSLPFLLAISIFTGSALILFNPAIIIITSEILVQMLYGAVFFASCIMLLVHGTNSRQNYLLWLGGIGFTAQALYVYFETFKDLLNTSLFFLIGGLLLLILSVIALRLSKNSKQQIENQKAAS